MVISAAELSGDRPTLGACSLRRNLNGFSVFGPAAGTLDAEGASKVYRLALELLFSHLKVVSLSKNRLTGPGEPVRFAKTESQ